MDFGLNFFRRNRLSFDFKSGQDFSLLVCAYRFCVQSSARSLIWSTETEIRGFELTLVTLFGNLGRNVGKIRHTYPSPVLRCKAWLKVFSFGSWSPQPLGKILAGCWEDSSYAWVPIRSHGTVERWSRSLHKFPNCPLDTRLGKLPAAQHIESDWIGASQQLVLIYFFAYLDHTLGLFVGCFKSCGMFCMIFF